MKKKEITPPKSKNITRFTYENTAFQGWRLCISRAGKTFVKYFSDKRYGGMEESRKAALEVLARLEEALSTVKRVRNLTTTGKPKRCRETEICFKKVENILESVKKEDADYRKQEKARKLKAKQDAKRGDFLVIRRGRRRKAYVESLKLKEEQEKIAQQAEEQAKVVAVEEKPAKAAKAVKAEKVVAKAAKAAKPAAKAEKVAAKAVKAPAKTAKAAKAPAKSTKASAKKAK